MASPSALGVMRGDVSPYGNTEGQVRETNNIRQKSAICPIWDRFAALDAELRGAGAILVTFVVSLKSRRVNAENCITAEKKGAKFEVREGQK